METRKILKKKWINFAKACSIGGVVLQHVNGYVYTNQYIFYSVWWAVALFVMIGGYNAGASFENRGEVVVGKRLKDLLIPYSFATAIYVFYANRFFDISEYLTRLIHFDATGPLYYVAVYAQLVIVTPVLIAVLKWCDDDNLGLCIVKYFASLVVILAICYCSTHFTSILGIWFGGGDVFAGPWLIFWFLGMCIQKIYRREISIKAKGIALIFNTISLVLWQYVFVNKGVNLTLFSIFNSQKVSMTWANALETVLLFFWFKYFIEIIEHFGGKIGEKILMPFDMLGQHTLYIFLYHNLFVYIYRAQLEISGSINRWLCLAFVILMPVLVGLVLSKFKQMVASLLKDIRIVW